MEKLLIDENGEYGLDCTYAVWASDKMHDEYHHAKVQLSDADFLVEEPNSDAIMRKRLRARMKTLLPFALQENMNTGISLIEKVDVLPIQEWNMHNEYGKYPFVKLNEN